MTILDSNLIFDPAGTAITASAASTNILDMGITNGIGGNVRDMGIGDSPSLTLIILSNGLFAAGGAATLNIQIQGAPDNGSGAPGTYTTYAESAPLSIATLNAFVGSTAQGVKLFPVDLPVREAGSPLPRFYRLNYVVATGPFTAGTLQAYLAPWREDGVAYQSGFSTAGF